MNKKTLYGVVSVVFFAVFMLHVVRILLGLSFVVGGVSLAVPFSLIPILVSVIVLNEIFDVKNRFWVMGEKTLDKFLLTVFSFVALTHLVRLIVGFSVILEGFPIPLWVSLVGFMLAFFLAFAVAGFIGTLTKDE